MYKSLLDIVADAQSLDELTVLDDVVLLDVGEKTTTTANEHEQATTGVVILRVLLQVLGQVVDPFSQKGDLHLGRTGRSELPESGGGTEYFSPQGRNLWDDRRPERRH